MKMPLCRLRQATEIIAQRKRAEFKSQAALTEWSTKNLASIVAATAQVDKKGARQLAQAIDKMTLNVDGPVEDDRTIEDIIEGEAIVNDRRNDRVGSFEAAQAFMEQAKVRG